MIKIICDTMIWYELSKCKLKTPNPEKYTLVCTYLSLAELAFSPNNFSKLNVVQKAFKQILTSKPDFILPSPFDYARTLIDKDYKPEFKIEEDLVFGFLRGLLSQPKEGLCDNEFKAQMSNVSNRRKENSGDWAGFLNELNEPIKEIKSVLKRYNFEEWNKTVFQEWFVLQLNQLSETIYSADDIDWRNFIFYENIFRRYHRNLVISKMKAKANDDNDLKNMIYVQPENLYWTLEKRWLSIAREMKIEHYLYWE